MANDDRFNPASADRDMFTEAITRALGDMTDAQIESLVQSAVGTEMSQRQMADLNLQSALETAVSAIRSEMTQKASTSDVTAAVADEAAVRQAADAELHDAVGAVAALGAKNLLNDKALNATSGTGVTITPNGDGTYALSGTPTGTATYLCTSLGNYTNLLGLETEKSYTITAGSNKVLIRVDYSTNGTSWDNGEDGQPLVSNVAGGASFTIPASAVGLYIRFRSTTSSGSLNGIVLKPMIRRAEITDDTYMPYAPTNRELYEMILALQSGVSAQSSAASLMQAGRIDAELTDAQEVTDDA